MTGPVGVLALQGAFREHREALDALGVASVEVRVPADLAAVHRAGYYRGNCVIAAAGHVDHGQLLTVLEREGWFEGAAEPGRDLLAQAKCYRLTPSIGFVRAWAFEDDPSDPVAAAQAAYMVSGEKNAGSPS